MRILALETSTQPGSLAVLDDAACLTETELPRTGSTASVLFPLLVDQLQQVGLSPGDINLVAVAVGPGSFTGTRIGVTVAKTWAYARQIPVCGVATPDVLAEQARSVLPSEDVDLWTVLDAQRGQLFVNRFRREPGNPDAPELFQAQGECVIEDRLPWLEKLRQAGPCHVTGTGLRPLVEELRSMPQVAIVPETQWVPRAAAVGRLAHRLYQRGEVSDTWRLAPQYVRKSAAEEKWDARAR